MVHRVEDKSKVTLAKIAELAGTTKSTVSRVLSGNPRISEKTREKVLRIVNQHNYRPNQLARNLARGRTDTISVVSANIGGGAFFGDVIRGIDLENAENGLRTICSFAHSADEFCRDILSMGSGGASDGVILLAPHYDLFKRSCISTSAMVLCAARPFDDVDGWSSLDSVTLDNAAAMKELIGHFLEQGFRRLVYLSGGESNFDALDRSRVFAQETKALTGIEIDMVNAGYTYAHGAGAAMDIRPELVDSTTGFIAFNDSCALGFTQGLKERFRDSGIMLHISGWDDSPETAALGLTTIGMPVHELGRCATKLLLRRIHPDSETAAPVHEKISQQLVIRPSTRAGISL